MVIYKTYDIGYSIFEDEVCNQHGYIAFNLTIIENSYFTTKLTYSHQNNNYNFPYNDDFKNDNHIFVGEVYESFNLISTMKFGE